MKEAPETRYAGLLGYPLGHSLSPAFQQAAFDHCSLPVRYDAWSIPPARLRSEVERLRGDAFLGANVTVPHKEAVMSMVDEVEPWARRIGAVNTIVKDGELLVGHNTDAGGFIAALRESGGVEPRGKGVVLLGAGGASRAAAFALASEGASWLTIANRTLERAQALAADLRETAERVEAVPLEGSRVTTACARADIIVNCTSIGMLHSDDEGRSPVDGTAVPSTALVYDMVYNPAQTPLLVEAGQAGARTLGGLSMLVYQGAASFELWTGREAPVQVMFEAARRALAASQP